LEFGGCTPFIYVPPQLQDDKPAKTPQNRTEQNTSRPQQKPQNGNNDKTQAGPQTHADVSFAEKPLLYVNTTNPTDTTSTWTPKQILTLTIINVSDPP
jgi:hypothetical protein